MKPRLSLPLTSALCALVAALALLGLRSIGLESIAPVSGVARAGSLSRDGNAEATSPPTFHALADGRATASSETSLVAALSADVEGLPSLADLLEAEQGDLSDPAVRERVVGRLREIEQTRRAAAEREAASRGLPVRVERAGGVVQELVAFENGQPVYFTTHNLSAAISSGASALRAAPYNLTGSGVKVGVWDGGSVRASHQEFAAGARVTVKDGSVSIDHATHVAGTIAAAGIVASARGMATAAGIDSYDWNSDKAEMTARAAAAPGQPDALYLSNHSYGYISGWNYVAGGSPSRVWEWHGNGTNAAAAELDFGRYNVFARDSDALAAGALRSRASPRRRWRLPRRV
ncbi:MAG: hypothetical protein MUE42_15630 [Opitutaceae bacterium]|nr:hypothetical protein [Opitutaceae bacterium]